MHSRKALPNTQNDADSSTNNEKIVVATAGIGMFLSTLDTGIMNVALPTLGQEFHVDVTSITWTVTAYLMTLSAMIVIFGRLSDRYGRVKIYRWGLGAFALSSLLAGCSFSIGTLVLFRGVQGIAAAMIQATVTALITTLVAPERRGTALGTLGIMIGLGPVLGPAVGGLLLSSLGWRWIFWINLPFCLLGLWGCSRFSRGEEVKNPFPIDFLGNVFFALATFALLELISTFSINTITQYQTWLPFLLFLLFLVCFLFWESRTLSPTIHLTWFRHASLTVPLLATVAFGAATAVVFIVPPYFLEGIQHLLPWQVGCIALSAPLGVVILARFSGKAIAKRGTYLLMVIGLLLMLLALGALSSIQSTWSVFLFAFLLLLYGVGGGTFQAPNIAAVMSSLGKDLQGTIGAVQRMAQNVAIALGASISATILRSHSTSSPTTTMQGFQLAFLVATGIVLFSLICFALTWKYRPKKLSQE